MFLKVISLYLFISLGVKEVPVHMHRCQRKTLGVLLYQSSLEIGSLALSGARLTVTKSQ